MMKNKKIYNFNIALIVLALGSFVSSLLLKIFYGQTMLSLSFTFWVWAHITINSFLLIALLYHLYLHWGSFKNWAKRVKSLNAKINTTLTYLFIFTMFSGFIAMISFFMGNDHNFIGGIHGKFGILFILFAILHTLKRLKWFKGRQENEVFIPVIDHESCVKCKKCMNKCPADVFTFENKKIVVKYEDFCIQCKKCTKICPKNAIR